jgi:hypothetical protein
MKAVRLRNCVKRQSKSRRGVAGYREVIECIVRKKIPELEFEWRPRKGQTERETGNDEYREDPALKRIGVR